MADVINLADISAKDICRINKDVTGSDYGDRGKAVSACLSSYSYYDDTKDQISSIVYSLVKGHFFPDGNKRTALTVLGVLCKANKISLNKNGIVQKMVDLASNKYSIPQVTEILFN